MNKKEFVKAVSSEGGLPLSDAARAVEAMIQVICYAISKGQKVVLSGFGTFLTREYPARKGYNPRVLGVEPRRVAKFRSGTRLKAAADKKR